jgi:DNA gyrase subunit A
VSAIAYFDIDSFSEKDARPLGRVSQGVIGMRLDKKQKVISLIVAKEEGNVLTATENGYGKQTPIKEFSLRKRGGKGVIAIQTSKRNGKLIAANQVQPDDEVIFISSVGNLIRTAIDNISVIGRNTQGVKLIRLNDGDKLLEMERIIKDSNDE